MAAAVFASGRALPSAPLVGDARSAAPAAGLIAFTRADGIYLLRADGTGERPLRRGGAAAGVARLAWSPDGRTLAFTNTKGALWVMAADGSRLVRLVTAADIAAKVILGPLTWSPDGRRIAFTAIRLWSAGEKVREWDIYVANTDGTGVKRLARTPHIYEFDVDWSPSGDRLAVSDMYAMFSRMQVMTTSGKIVASANPSWGWEVAMPDWSPEGRRLTFIEWPHYSDGSGTLSDAEIWVTTPSGNWRRLTWNRDVDSNPVWSPDGRKIAFLRGRSPGTVLLWPPEKHSAAELYVMNADGSRVTRLTHNDLGEGSPTWQPIEG